MQKGRESANEVGQKGAAQVLHGLQRKGLARKEAYPAIDFVTLIKQPEQSESMSTFKIKQQRITNSPPAAIERADACVQVEVC